MNKINKWEQQVYDYAINLGFVSIVQQKKFEWILPLTNTKIKYTADIYLEIGKGKLCIEMKGYIMKPHKNGWIFMEDVAWKARKPFVLEYLKSQDIEFMEFQSNKDGKDEAKYYLEQIKNG